MADWGLLGEVLDGSGRVFSRLDHRREECEVTEAAVRPGFRRPPDPRTFWRWYETWIVGFIVASVVLMRACAVAVVLPAVS